MMWKAIGVRIVDKNLIGVISMEIEKIKLRKIATLLQAWKDVLDEQKRENQVKTEEVEAEKVLEVCIQQVEEVLKNG